MIRLKTDLRETLQQGGTLVVPSPQRAHAARLAYASAQLRDGRRVWKSPDILSVDAWLTREIEGYSRSADARLPRLLSSTEEWLLWRQSAAAATDEWDLVNRSALAEALRAASALAADFNIDVRRLPDAPGTEPALLREVQSVVEERCGALGAATLASLLARLPASGDAATLVLRGFLKLSPRLQAIAARRGAVADGRVTADLRGAGSGIQPGIASRAAPRAVIAPDDVGELELIAQWCKAQIERRADARVLVVLAGAAGARERLATLIRQMADPRAWLDDPASGSLVVIEGGSPLARNPAIAHALATLESLCGRSLDFDVLSEWLRAPFWNRPDAAARARLDLWLRGCGRLKLALRDLVVSLRGVPSELAEAARVLSSQIEEATAVLGPGTLSPRDWSQRFRAALEAFGWPGDRERSSGDQQTLARFHELLDEFGQLASTARSMPREAAIQWFAELAVRTPFRPADEDAVVTITPMLADPVVHYDAIWVAGLHSEAFPQPVQPDPFLPLAAQIAARVPWASAQGRLLEARGLLEAWRESADELVLSVPARNQDLELLPSPLLAPWLERVTETRLQHGSAWLAQRLHREGLLESLDDGLGIAWPIEQPLPAGTRSLELQNTCPFRAYAELRLGSVQLDAPEPGVAADLRGKLLHAALQKVWMRWRDSATMTALTQTELGAQIAEALEAAARETAGTDAMRSRSMARELRRTARLIGALCDLERERAPFQVRDTERAAALSVAGGNLNLRIDRVDRLEGGGLAILDYKSGQRTSADWYGERPSHPQLLAYLAALGDEVVAMATVNVTAREVRFDGVASIPGILPRIRGVKAPEGWESSDAWALRKVEWLSRLERMAAGFIAGEAVVDPKPGACDYCHVRGVCRISDRSMVEPDVIADEEALDSD